MLEYWFAGSSGRVSAPLAPEVGPLAAERAIALVKDLFCRDSVQSAMNLQYLWLTWGTITLFVRGFCCMLRLAFAFVHYYRVDSPCIFCQLNETVLWRNSAGVLILSVIWISLHNPSSWHWISRRHCGLAVCVFEGAKGLREALPPHVTGHCSLIHPVP